ncbi:MAG: crotonase/enoyl-CoA hydratase family protein [Bacteroidia bacterium]|jgi:enoyl-CoA hydratase|nr:crotonase/enoyl-CoA hydratase family protein [Bacteroidia bacterium]
MTFQTLSLDIQDHIAQLRFNRPEKANALNQTAWEEMQAAFEYLDGHEPVRVIVLAGEGKHFCAGIDLEMLMSISQQMNGTCEGRKREGLRRTVLKLQDCVSAIERCRKPVLAAIHGGCIGGGIDIVSACDMRYATDDAYFTVKEIDMGMVADLGTLQRLPRLIPDGIARELAYTGRKMAGPEAMTVGLVNRTFADRDSLLAGVTDIARTIAAKSPLSVRGTKEMILYTRDHDIADGLNYIATWNAGMLLSEDLMQAFQASMTKQPPVFRD